MFDPKFKSCEKTLILILVFQISTDKTLQSN